VIERDWSAYMRERRAVAAAEGKCSTCCARAPEPGYLTCDECINGAERRRDSMGKTFCVDCAAFGFHRSMCTRAA
jgi:hypothetical protein